MLVIQMHTGTGLFSRLIRWFSRSDYSHVSLWFWNPSNTYGGVVYEAMEGHGVRALPATAYRAAREAGQIRLYTLREPLTPDEAVQVVLALEAEIGAGYDWLGVLRFVSRRRKDGHPKKWFCSELVTYALAKAGRPLFHTKAAWQVMPGDVPQSLAVIPTDDPERAMEGDA